MKDSKNQDKVLEQPQKDIKPGIFSFENLRSLTILILAVFALRWSVASPYHVPTASMEPTIKVGDRLLAFKLAYGLKIPFTDWTLLEWNQPKRGDIIVFKYPQDPDIDYVKRIVAVAGDKIHLVDNVLYINGKAQEQVDHNNDRTILDDIDDQKDIKLLFRENLEGTDHWVIRDMPSARRSALANWPPFGQEDYIVPENSVFVIGDNRDNSADSRRWHEVPLSYIRGKALFVLWSMHSPKTGWPSLRWNRFGYWLQ